MNDFTPSPDACKAFRQVFNDGPGLYPSSRNYGQFSTGGSLHDTFRIDRYDNVYGGHTSYYLPGGQKTSIDW